MDIFIWNHALAQYERGDQTRDHGMGNILNKHIYTEENHWHCFESDTIPLPHTSATSHALYIENPHSERHDQ